MPVLNGQVVANSYANNQPGAIISGVYNSRGGWYSVSGAAVFVQQQYGDLGSLDWQEEVLVGAGAFAYLDKACRGIRFRNAVSGQVATVTAQISSGAEPPMSIIALGNISISSVPKVTRTIRTTPGASSYTLPAGVTVILVEVVGGGGGGGGTGVTAAAQAAAGGGGAGGTYASRLIAVSLFTSPATLVTTVGAAGAGVSGASGNPGGASSFAETGGLGTWVQGDGGPGGLGGLTATPPIVGSAGIDGTIATAVGEIIVPGGPGGASMNFGSGASNQIGGEGGTGGGPYGGGGSRASGPGGSGVDASAGLFGGGGNGATAPASTATRAGGGGASGIVVITEFYS